MNGYGMRPGIILLREGTDTSQGLPQLISNINACQAVADVIRTTLGPAGRDKLIATNKVTISNDGATIMRLLEISHPAAKTLVDISISQDVQVGDGTTSVVLLAAEVMTRLKPLLEEGLHPVLIMKQLRQISQLCVESIREMAVPCVERDMLINTASTALNSKLISNHKDLFAPQVVEAVQSLHKADLLDHMEQLIAVKQVPGGQVRQSRLVAGVAFAKTFSYAGFDQMKKTFDNPKILLLNVELELKAEKENAEVRISAPDQYQAIVDAEWQVIYDKLQACVDIGANVVLSRLPIGDLATQFFADRGLFCAGRVPEADLKRVAKATGGAIQTTTRGLTTSILGTCGNFSEQLIGEERFNVFSECPQQLTWTFLLRGGTEQFIAESERSIHDALQVVRRTLEAPTVVAGGGAVEMQLSALMKKHALTISGKGQWVVQAFAKALEVIPRQLCDNAGFDSTDIVSQLRTHHANTKCWYGVDLENGSVCDTFDAGVWEPAANKIHSLQAATEAACCILSIDETIISPASQNAAQQASGMMGGGTAGMSGLMNSAMNISQGGGPPTGKLAPGVTYMKGRGGK